MSERWTIEWWWCSRHTADLAALLPRLWQGVVHFLYRQRETPLTFGSITPQAPIPRLLCHLVLVRGLHCFDA